MENIILENIGTLVSSIILASLFFISSRWRLMEQKTKGYREVASFGAGIAIAYVFMNFLPELSAASAVFVEHTHNMSLPFPQYRVYGASLLGFVLFYGLQYMVRWSAVDDHQQHRHETLEKIRFAATIIGYTLYTGLICYLMVHGLEEGHSHLALYTVAMAFHFISLRSSLWNKYGAMYRHRGKNLLGLSCLVGWTLAVFFPLPVTIVITLLGFVSGGVIMSTMIAEMPKEKEGHFLFFFLGAVFYTSLLIAI